MLLFCHRSNFLTIFFFYQLCCPTAKATVILETATSSLVSSPLLLTTNPALRVVSCPHAYSLTRRIPVFFFFFLLLWRGFFSLPWPQAQKREVFAPPPPASSFIFICSPMPEFSTIFWTFFSPPFAFFGFWAELQHFSWLGPASSVFWPASKSNRQITESLLLFSMFPFIRPLTFL